ncbi:MAG TPA: ABC transporter permease [Ktedonobacterales bacterium]|nr:ABC transporter permease [Ktedonobacterales bacterium]
MLQTVADNAGALLVLVAVLAFFVFVTLRLGVRFLLRRLGGLVFVTLGVSFLTFILGYLAPGDVIYQQLGVHYRPDVAARLRHEYGLDLPWYEQYAHYLNNLLHFNLGISYLNQSSTVWDILQRYLPASLTLGFWGTVLTIVFGIPMGMSIAARPNTRFDTSMQMLALILYTLPIFVIIPFYDIAMVWLHAHNLPSLPTSGWGTWDTESVPIVLYALSGFGYFVRLTRTTMIEELSKDYVRAARAKGLTENEILWRHAFRNALLPLLSAIGPSFAYIVAGVFIIENLFNIPGIGSATIEAISGQDVPVIQGTTILFTTALVIMNLATDIAYGFADPRIKTDS